MYKNCNPVATYCGSRITKYLLMTKLAIIFTFVVSFQALAGSISAQGINIELKNVSLESALKAIESQGAYRFVYKTETLPKDKLVSVSAENAKLGFVMERILLSTSLSYEVINNNLVVIVTQDLNNLKATISGRVTDVDQNPLAGVSVLVKGTSNGIATKADGSFSLNISAPNPVLVFSSLGYVKQELKAADNMVVVLEKVNALLEDVVVVGYGTQKKASVLASIVQVTGDDLKKTGGVVNLAQAMTGRLPGVTTVQATGEPGRDDPTILIRGMGTWNNAQPLILVDGIERRMNDIDVNEVESISVLKDATATAVYGVKGAEGVILITTKRGKVGKPVISVDASVSTKRPSRIPKKLNSYDQFKAKNDAIEYHLSLGADTEWENFMPEAMLQNYKQPQAPGMEYIFPDVDWVKEMIKPLPVSHRYNLNVSGGSDFAKYFGSISYTYDDDLLRTGDDPMNSGYKTKFAYERLNFRTNLDLNLTKTTVFSTNLAGWVGTKSSGYGDDLTDEDAVRAFAEASPDQHALIHADGAYGYNPAFTRSNPYEAANSGGLGKRRRTNVTTDFAIRQNLDFITKGLSARASLSYDNNFYSDGGIQDGGVRRLWIDPEIVNMRPNETPQDYMMGYINIQNQNHDYDWTPGTVNYVAEASGFGGESSRRLFYQGQLNYARTFNRHDVGALALINREEFAQGSMFPRYREDWVGRVTYNYDYRYLFESNFAYNGSEKFAQGKRFGFFPSVAVGWVLSNEAFFKRDWIDNLKFRYSVGKVGNDNFSAPRWSYQTNWSLADRTRFGYPQTSLSPYVQYVESVIGNPELSWETSLKQNLALEVALFRNRVSMNVDVFKDHRTDIFLSADQRTLPEYFGHNPVAANLGETEVKGYEFELTFRNLASNKFRYYVTVQHTGARDKIIYREDPPLMPDYQKNEGFPINQVRTQIGVGFLNNWDDVYSAIGYQNGNDRKLPGDYRILDYNAAGVVNPGTAAPYSYPRDRPQHSYGLILGGEYKGFNAMIQFYGVYNFLREYTGWVAYPFINNSKTGPVMEQHLDMWTPENPTGRYRHMRPDMSTEPGNVGMQFEDGSSLRLQTAEIGYKLTPSSIQKIGLKALRFYLNGNNLLFWSKAVEDRDGRSGGTASDTVYPTLKRINMGVNVQF